MAGEAALFAILSNEAAVTAKVATRIYPAPSIPVDATVPFVAYGVISAIRAVGSGTNPGLVDVRFQLDCVGRTFGEALALAAALVGVLDRYTPGTYGGENILDVRVENEQDQYSFESDRAWRTVDVLISVKE